MALRFAKYEGLGNDFLMVDADDLPLDALTPALAAKLCDRHRGVGGDGVLWVDRAQLASEGRARMVIYNADGTRPEMCGNGVRCVAAWLADRGEVKPDASVVIDSDAGERPVRFRGRDGDAWSVEVTMGRARMQDEPSLAMSFAGPQPVEVVDLGNPHGVVFAPEGDDRDLIRAVEALAAFPKGVNVEFVKARAGGGFRVRVHERGVGWTQACGTGACAVAAAAVARGRASRGAPVAVELDGGVLSIVVGEAHPDGASVWMTGPARRAFEGSV